MGRKTKEGCLRERLPFFKEFYTCFILPPVALSPFPLNCLIFGDINFVTLS